MQVYLMTDNQFGEKGPQRGAKGYVFGFSHGGEYAETMFFVRFDNFYGTYWVDPKHLGYFDGSSTFGYWRWQEGYISPLEKDKREFRNA